MDTEMPGTTNAEGEEHYGTNADTILLMEPTEAPF